LLKTIFSDGLAYRLPVFKRKEGTDRARTEEGGTETSRVVNTS
jgi:hypothetical protein